MTEGSRYIGIGASTFFTGLVAGIGAGLLLAPQSGARTRRQLYGFAKDIEEETSHVLDGAKASIDKAIEQSKSFIG